MDKAELEKYRKCEICDLDMGNIQYDTPVYCRNCITEMGKRSMSPKKFIKYRELKETLKR